MNMPRCPRCDVLVKPWEDTAKVKGVLWHVECIESLEAEEYDSFATGERR